MRISLSQIAQFVCFLFWQKKEVACYVNSEIWTAAVSSLNPITFPVLLIIKISFYFVKAIIMVLQNGFNVNLYNPDTKILYKEFRKGNDSYIEAEPGAQYFVDIRLADHGVIDDTKHIQAHLFVDGHDLGDRYNIPSNGDAVRVGMHDKKGSRALAFALSRLNAVAASGAENRSCNYLLPICSQIIVCFHLLYDDPCHFGSCPTTTKFENRNSTVRAKENFSRRIEMATIDVTASQRMELKNTKVIRSVSGTAYIPYKQESETESLQEIEVTTSQNCDNDTLVELKKCSEPKKYRRGRHLTTVTLNYCSTVGLIMVGVLEKPTPDWITTNGVTKKRPGESLEEDDKIKESITIYHDSNSGLSREAFLIDLTDL